MLIFLTARTQKASWRSTPEFLGVDIQEELENFQTARTISVGDYQYLSSGSPQKSVQEPRRIEAIGFRVPPAVVVTLVLIVLVGVPVFSYLALNLTRVADTNQVDYRWKHGDIRGCSHQTGSSLPIGSPIRCSLKPSPAEENPVVAPSREPAGRGRERGGNAEPVRGAGAD